MMSAASIRKLFNVTATAAAIYTLFVAVYFEFSALQITAAYSGSFEVTYLVTSYGTWTAILEALVMLYGFCGGTFLILENLLGASRNPPVEGPVLRARSLWSRDLDGLVLVIMLASGGMILISWAGGFWIGMEAAFAVAGISMLWLFFAPWFRKTYGHRNNESDAEP